MTSPVDTSVKYFHSAMPGAPVMSGTVGAMIAVLDACLVNGWGLVTLDSLVIAGNVAKASKSTGLSYDIGAVVLMAGATPAALNGEQKVVATDATSVSFATTGLADQTATGTITLKLAPATWAKTFAGTNLAAYKPTDVAATGMMLRVDDTVAKTSRVVGYETMSDVNTGTGPFPTAVQRSGGCWWNKSNAADATARQWILIADGRFLYFCRNHYLPNIWENELSVFGDLVPTKTGDAYSCLLTGQATDISGSAAAVLNQHYTLDPGQVTGDTFCPRNYLGLGSSTIHRRAAPSLAAQSVMWMSGGQSTVSPFPNPQDGGLYVSPVSLYEGSNLSLRGVSPGFYVTAQSVPNGMFTNKDTITGVSGLTGKTLKAVTCALSAQYGVCFFDVTGPWR